MSRVHDALRRAAMSPPPPARSGRTDAVLAAFGYGPGKSRSNIPRVVLGVAAVLLIVLIARPHSGPVARPVTSSATVTPGRVVPAAAVPAGTVPRTAVPVTPVPVTPAPGAAVLVASRTPGPSALPLTQPPAAPVAPRPALPHPHPSGKPSLASPLHTKAAPADGSPARGQEDFQLALYYQRAGEFDQALVHYQAVLQRNELNVEAHNNLGHLYLAKGLLDEAQREFQRVIAIDPGYAPAHVNLSAVLVRQGRFDAASAEARAALTIEPRNVDALVNLAIAQKGAGQTVEAQATLIRALGIEHRHAAAHYNLAQLYEDAGELALARQHYEAFLQSAGPDQSAFAADARSRLAAISTRIR